MTIAAAAPTDTSRAALHQGSVSLRPEVAGVHPRLFVTPAELAATAERFRRDPAFFASLVPSLASRLAHPIPMDEGENGWRAAGEVMQCAILFRVTGEPRTLQALEEWLPMMEAFQPLRVEHLGVKNHDLTAGALLCGFATAYDLLKDQADARTVGLLRQVLVGQAGSLYADLCALKTYPYEQNHLTIPLCGLALASLALCDERNEAKDWLVFSHNTLDRCLKAIAYDGWFFESVSYWNFTMQFPLLYAAALRRTTGEDLFQGQFFGNTAGYLAHTFLPGCRFAFDFADWGPRVNPDGKTAQHGYDAPWHTLPTDLFMVVPLVHETTDPLLRAVVEKIVAQEGKGPSGWDRSFAALWGFRLPEAPAGAWSLPPYHYFPDMEVVHWRQNWTDANATAIAFKSGPPAGHHTTRMISLYPDWKPSLGHAHPDAGSFLLFSRGVFLANDTGYAIKASRWHNTLTVDGVGQGTEGTAWSTWDHWPAEALDRVRMADVWLGANVAAATAVFEDAYAPTTELRKMRRHLVLVDGRFLVVADEIASDVAHTFDWYLHTDREPQPLGADRWQMENGPARLVIRNLGPVASSRIEPTVVETELFDQKVTRPQQRGFHLNLRSPAATEFRFLTAMGIQPVQAAEKAFTAKTAAPGQIEMADGTTSCRVWIGPQEGFDGTFAFVLREGGKVTAVGLSGKRLDSEAGRLDLPEGGQVILRVSAGGWTAEGDPPTRWTLR